MYQAGPRSGGRQPQSPRAVNFCLPFCRMHSGNQRGSRARKQPGCACPPQKQGFRKHCLKLWLLHRFVRYQNAFVPRCLRNLESYRAQAVYWPWHMCRALKESATQPILKYIAVAWGRHHLECRLKHLPADHAKPSQPSLSCHKKHCEELRLLAPACSRLPKFVA
jgi:hypothetical protein